MTHSRQTPCMNPFPVPPFAVRAGGRSNGLLAYSICVHMLNDMLQVPFPCVFPLTERAEGLAGVVVVRVVRVVGRAAPVLCWPVAEDVKVEEVVLVLVLLLVEVVVV